VSLLPAFVTDDEAVLNDIASIVASSPFVGMHTPGGLPMSVQTTSCGRYGWTSDDRGYRYTELDPRCHRPWPPMPARLRVLAQQAATTAGYAGFDPDACLINRYAPGARMTLHQDRQEASFAHPVVSLSFGLPAVFLMGGIERSAPTMRIPLAHGDAIVWGGPSRLRFHGVLPVRPAPQQTHHPITHEARINLTFRVAG
jgi:DNA oxidative demethylase